ncbi:hypothetical protein TWF718_005094 [Orbilia javanica]|uniref:Uncharacterized protein n=1 Tax=Orbilia javanica TaxID=47235 RepID=A0AAN8N783_9PEZI
MELKAFQPGQQDCIFHHNNTQTPTENRFLSLLSLKGRTAVVTGAGGGIGFAVVEAFAEAGANVALWYNTSALARTLSKGQQRSQRGKAYQVDLTDEAALNATLDQTVIDLNGRLDIFVSNAGIPWLYGRVIDSPSDQFLHLMNVNLMTSYYAAKAAGKYFERQKLEGTNIKGENLENYNCGGSFIAGTPYGVSKAALTHLAKGLAIEFVKFARVNIVSPAYIDTEMLKVAPDSIRTPWKGRTPMGREGTVNEIKGAYVYLASDASSYATGTEIVIDGGPSTSETGKGIIHVDLIAKSTSASAIFSIPNRLTA